MDKLRFIALSGTTEVTQNIYLYEYKDDLIVVDCGVGFPDSEMYGVDLVIPDFSYIKERKHKLRGVIITHGHEDHFGSLPFLLKDIKAPVFATKLVAGFINDKLSEYKVSGDIRVFDPERDIIHLGNFKINPFYISHSVPDSVGLVIETQEGKIFHVPDYKFDWTPVDGKPFDAKKAVSLANDRVLLLASDCLGATTPGYTESERSIEQRIETIAQKAEGAVFFSTISSNISRVKQALNVALKLNRKVVFVGRSVKTKAQIAQNLGYLRYPAGLVIPLKEASSLPRQRLFFIISGSYGQPGSALDKLSKNEHKEIKAKEGDVVIFSSDPAPPGTKANVDAVVDRFFKMNLEVHYYDLQEDLHVSGHGSIKDIEMLAMLIKPQYFAPIGGTIRHMRAYRNIIEDLGFDPKRVFELLPGDVVVFEKGKAFKAGNIEPKNILVDGLGVGDVGSVVLRDRQRLSQDGVVITLVQFVKEKDGKIFVEDIISRGFVFEKKKKGFLKETKKRLEDYLKKRGVKDLYGIKTSIVDFLEKYFWARTKRRPMIIPLVIEV